MRVWWDLALLVTVCVEMLAIPFELGYDYELPLEYLLFVTCFFSVDICLAFFTGYFGPNQELIMEHSKIIRRYLRTWFCIDLLATIPFDLLLNAMPAADTAGQYNGLLKTMRVTKQMRMIRLLRMSRGLKLFQVLDHIARFIPNDMFV